MENESKTQSSKGAKVLKAIVNTIVNILIVIVLITSLLIAVMALTSKSNGISTLFGYTVQTIESDSMKGSSPDGYEGGDVEHGDLMIAKATGFDPDVEFQLGDIVTFRSRDTDGNIMLIVHRIVDRYLDEDGVYRYQTWGDNREVSQIPDQTDKMDYIFASNIGSVFYSDSYQGKVFKGAGNVLAYLRTQQGFFLVVLLPMILFFMYELVRVVLNMSNYRRAKAEEDKEAAVKAALAENSSGVENFTPEQLEQFKKFMEQQKDQDSPTDPPAET